MVKKRPEFTVEDLARGFRTYVAAASAWLYQDPKLTTRDREQQRNLADVVIALDKLAARQAAIAEDVVRSLLIDHLVVALKTKEGNGPRPDPDTGRLEKTEMPGRNRGPHDIPARVPHEWYRGEALFQDEDPVARGLRIGYWVYTHLIHGHALVLDPRRAEYMSVAAQQLRIRFPGSPQIPAAPIAAALVYDLLDDASFLDAIMGWEEADLYARMEAFVQEEVRRLRARHPDREAVEDVAADARYFGAFRERSPSSVAAEFVAAVVGGDAVLAESLECCSTRSPLMWSAAAVGRSASNAAVIAETAMHTAIIDVALAAAAASAGTEQAPVEDSDQ